MRIFGREEMAMSRVWPVGVAVLLFISVISAASPEPVQNSEWALEISEKEFDESTGQVSLRITNANRHLAVTAFAVSVVYDRGGGRGGTRIYSEELLPGEPLAPGAIHEMTFDFGVPGEHEVGAPGFTALQVSLHFEILADTTSRGSLAYIDELFAKRAHLVQELETMLARLRAVRNDSLNKSLQTGFWAEERQRRQEASHALKYTKGRLSQQDRYRYEAIYSLTDMSVQVKQRIDSGEPVEGSLGTMEWLLREHYLEPLAAGVRSQDLEKIREGNGGVR